ncbi:hypothetical protein J4H86_21675 [Spiractinospora alimapuensis]|uniref:hypothetical protein n=1 Tax=Spiractinospora alimapuensis TaxID=2820884 RepID=UPI001F1C0AC6|nr:hypothetical protein [Spiractinospora alimapuensis]QVQ51389.1 hypothetical protein J4H86_21675 [Spiractinospora alimapuensis]
MARALALLLLAVAVLLPSTTAGSAHADHADRGQVASESATDQGGIPSVGPLRGVISAASAVKGGNADPRPSPASHADHGIIGEFVAPLPTFAPTWVTDAYGEVPASGHVSSAHQRGPPEGQRFGVA